MKRGGSLVPPAGHRTFNVWMLASLSVERDIGGTALRRTI